MGAQCLLKDARNERNAICYHDSLRESLTHRFRALS